MLNEVLGFFAHVIPVGRVESVLARSNSLEQPSLIAVVERRVTTQENVDNNTQRPHVHLRSVVGSLQNLRGDVPRRTTIGDEETVLGGRSAFGKSKIS